MHCSSRWKFIGTKMVVYSRYLITKDAVRAAPCRLYSADVGLAISWYRQYRSFRTDIKQGGIDRRTLRLSALHTAMFKIRLP